jgi:hypothetical protein
MKKCLFGLLALMLALASCPGPQDDEEGGTITISLGANSAARWSGGPPDSNIVAQLTHVIKMWNGNSYNTLYKTIPLSPGATAHSEAGVPLGPMKITIDATLNGYPFAYGEEEFNVAAGPNNPIVRMNRLDYGVVLSADSGATYTFPPTPAGYSSPPSLGVTIWNYAENPTGALTVSSSASFSVSTANINSIARDGSNSFSVTPAAGLTDGNYNGTVTVAGGNGITASFDLSFNVLASDVMITGISAGSTGDILPTAQINDMKDNLTVTVHFSDDTTANLNPGDYTLSGAASFPVGTYTITVNYGGQTDTVAGPAHTPS